MILRCTQKLLKASGIQPEDVELEPEGLLGEWYATAVELPIRGRSVVMFTSASTLLTVVAPGRVLKSTLPVFRRRLPALLERLFVPSERIAREMSSLGDVRFAKTRDRQIVGCMTDLVNAIQGHAEYAEDPDEFDLNVVEIALAGNLSRFRSPEYDTAERRLRRLVHMDASGR